MGIQNLIVEMKERRCDTLSTNWYQHVCPRPITFAVMSQKNVARMFPKSIATKFQERFIKKFAKTLILHTNLLTNQLNQLLSLLIRHTNLPSQEKINELKFD